MRTRITLACTECNSVITILRKIRKPIRTEWRQRNIVDSARSIQCTKKPNNFSKMPVTGKCGPNSQAMERHGY